MRTMVLIALSMMMMQGASGETYLKMWEFKKGEVSDKLRATIIQRHRGFSLLKCSVECSRRTACFAFQYLQLTSSCALFRHSESRQNTVHGREYYTAVEPCKGRHYGDRCSSDSDCVDSLTHCIDHVCGCRAGYKIIQRNCSCGARARGSTAMKKFGHLATALSWFV